jgi:hypothetical protein
VNRTCPLPNEIHVEEGWPTSNDPLADSLEPPAASGKPAVSDEPEADQPKLPPAEDEKHVRLIGNYLQPLSPPKRRLRQHCRKTIAAS